MDRITGALRGKYEKLRQELDRKGVFHPEANAQRVHTMFMVQLTKWCVARHTAAEQAGLPLLRRGLFLLTVVRS